MGSPATQRAKRPAIVCRISNGGAFLVFNVLLIVTISGSVFQTIQTIIDNPTAVFEILARSIPGVSTFFVNYVILLALSGPAGELLQIANLILKPLKLRFLASTPRAIWRQSQPLVYLSGVPMASHSFIATVGVTYMTIAPLVSIMCLMYFGFWYLAYMNQMRIRSIPPLPPTHKAFSYSRTHFNVCFSCSLATMFDANTAVEDVHSAQFDELLQYLKQHGLEKLTGIKKNNHANKKRLGEMVLFFLAGQKHMQERGDVADKDTSYNPNPISTSTVDGAEAGGTMYQEGQKRRQSDGGTNDGAHDIQEPKSTEDQAVQTETVPDDKYKTIVDAVVPQWHKLVLAGSNRRIFLCFDNRVPTSLRRPPRYAFTFKQPFACRLKYLLGNHFSLMELPVRSNFYARGSTWRGFMSS
ncbi:hypothetical protein, variant [Spizellomyces punctatus DAOM BR117]|uniref:CSC1/OSCA1-like 7TM region domain-containing protein n=1 Tax=Spizellomyces punctatus (strain DAOM BR117) TaxID=645134 RepID=A0A0L0HFF7_SPIPD|nr:hypothetical protein, variant [Spizellomyces punctatus DAOM BR117]KND00201.1 hypothetical protein, variant [Spizellomyces punctatus DAOM BR117]|eukprot:XP_016608240.1 hypothetical protein, variant [Spizellomyces punctatus DAOM BR117]